jgi:hypothetical protein
MKYMVRQLTRSKHEVHGGEDNQYSSDPNKLNHVRQLTRSKHEVHGGEDSHLATAMDP